LYSIQLLMKSSVKTPPCRSQELMISFQSLQGIQQRARSRWDLSQLFRAEIVDVHIQRITGVNLVLDAVEPGAEHGGKGQVGVRGGIRAAELQTLGLGIVPREGNPHGSGAVALGVSQVHRSLKPRHQTLVGVGGGVGEGQQAGACLRIPPMYHRAVWLRPAYLSPAKVGWPFSR
jgi:hypothetical protein